MLPAQSFAYLCSRDGLADTVRLTLLDDSSNLTARRGAHAVPQFQSSRLPSLERSAGCPSPKFVTSRKRLIFRTVDRKVSRHARGGFKHIAIYHSCSWGPLRLAQESPSLGRNPRKHSRYLRDGSTTFRYC